MSTTVLHAPRIAAFAPVHTAFWSRLWNALEAHGQRRAAAELRRTAWRYQSSDPALALRLIEAARQAERG